jgi:hypothetical protein
MTRRIAVSGVATAIAAGALVGAASTAANAAIVADGTYTCDVAGTPAQLPVHVEVPLLPGSANAGTMIPAGLLQATTTVGIPAETAAVLQSYHVTGGTIDDFGMLVGTSKAPAPLTFTSFTPGTEAGSLVTSTLGVNQVFSLPKAGTYDITLPTAFTFMPTTDSGPLGVPVSCTSAAPAKMASIRIDKNTTTMSAKAPTSIKKGSAAKVVTTLASNNAGTPVPTGKVVAKLGTKTVGTGTLSNGRAVLKLVKLPVGKDKVSVKYAGDGFTAANKVPVTIKVTR